MSLRDRTLFITGASRGIGLAIALRAARDGANVVVAAKTAEPHPKLPGTIHTAARAIEEAGGRALAVVLDVRDEGAVAGAVEQAVATFGGIDILVNNASAIWLRGTLDTPMKRFDLMQEVNARGSFLCAQACLPYLLQAPNPHILSLAPPLSLEPKWWGPHVGYTLAKFRFRGRYIVFIAILSTLMIPTEMLVLPWYLMASQFGWIDSYWGIMFPGMMTAFGTFLMKQFFETVPKDFIEAARIDGLNEFTIWWRIAMPLVTPALSALWLELVTPVNASVARPLVEGLRSPTIAREERLRQLLPFELTSFEAAVRRALAGD